MYQKSVIFTLGAIQAFESCKLATLQQRIADAHVSSKLEAEGTIQKISTMPQSKKQHPIEAPTNFDLQTTFYSSKTKIIRKTEKERRVKHQETRDEMQTVLFKYFKRKLFGSSMSMVEHRQLRIFILVMAYIQKKIEIGFESQQCFDLAKIIDWQMEACENMCLSKDTFYTAVQINKKFYKKERNQLFPHKLMEVQVAAILSLAAKLESNKINYPEAISTVCGLAKSDIIDAEIYVMKSINFAIPLVSPQTELLNVCIKWHNFVTNNEKMLKLQTQTLKFGADGHLEQWQRAGQQNYMILCHVFDLIALKQVNKIDYSTQNTMRTLVTQSLFLLVNCKIKQFFPTKTSQKTYIMLIYENFLTENFNFLESELSEWANSLIKTQHKLKLLQKVYFYLNRNIAKQQESQDQDNTRTSLSSLKSTEFWKQAYSRSIFI